MNTIESVPQLNEELCQAIAAVKSARTLTTMHKKSLREHALITRNQIEDDVSFHLELLRNREVWLLGQVDIHAQMKEETFDSHLNELCAMLARLEGFQQLLKAPELEKSQVITNQAKKILLQINNELLHSEEEPAICFSGDNFALSDAVKNFGKVIIGEPCESLEKPPSVRKGQSKEFSHEVSFIREHFESVLSSAQEDWVVGDILKREESKDDPSGIQKYFEDLKKSNNEEWLCVKNQPMDVEAVSSSFTVHFNQVKAAPDTEWLQSGTATDLSDDTSSRVITSHMDTSEDINVWLLPPCEGRTLSTKREEFIDEGISLSRQSSVNHVVPFENHIGKEWLLKDNSIRDPVSVADEKDGDDWLLRGSKSSFPQEAQVDNWLQRFRDSTGPSASDWLMVSEAEPDYCEWLTQDSIERCKRCPGETHCARDNFGVFRNVLKSSREQWLATATDW